MSNSANLNVAAVKPKFEITSNTKVLKSGVVLRQIRALHKLPYINVNTGDLGGWIESEYNLSQEGDCWVADKAQVYGAARVSGGAQVFANAVVSGDAHLFGFAKVSGDAQVFGNAMVYGHAQLIQKVKVFGNADVRGTASLYGKSEVSGDTQVSSHNFVAS